MDRPIPFSRQPALRIAAACVAAGIALAAMVALGAVAAAGIFAGVAGVLLGWNHHLRSRLRNMAGRLSAIEGEIATRTPHPATAHPVTGLPLRETLLAEMHGTSGILGALALTDFERLTAFDPALAERVFAVSAERLRRMLPASRFAAQVDRSHIGLWFTAEDEAQARAELDAIAYALGEAIDEDGGRIVPQVRVCLARYDPAAGLDPGAFLARTLASFALSGRKAAAIEHAPSDHADLARDRYALEQDLRQAIARHELHVLFQPLVDAGRGRICGAEALLRWTHPRRGAVPPSHFIPIMEAIGLAGEIGAWTLNAAIREARDWATQGLDGLHVAVNISALQLERDDLPILLQRTLRHHGLGAHALEIELTESVATSDAQHSRRIFQKLRAMGVKLAVDDFGTGYSGFSSLRNLAFDKLKIDREFVTDVDTRADSQAICQSIIALGAGLGIRILAEGVERRGEYEWLRQHGCRHFQGYYFGRPMTGAAFGAAVRDTAGLTESLRLAGHARPVEVRRGPRASAAGR